MLTREEAKTKVCPYKYETSPSRAGGPYTDFNITCVAEECPKWVDVVIDTSDYNGARATLWCKGMDCPEEKSPRYMTPGYATKCLFCKYHIGRCGG